MRLKVGIIAGNKVSNALLCEVLEKNSFELVVCRYQIPPFQWTSWIYRRIKIMGFGVLIGHLVLSFYLRLQRLSERIAGKSLWLNYTRVAPSWAKVVATKRKYLSEENLIQDICEVDIVVQTDEFRLSSAFYRQIKKPIIQIVWGKVPQYAGNSGGFWAYALNDKANTGVTIIRRGNQYDKLQVLKQIPVQCEQNENLRTIKIRQVLAVARELPEVIQTVFSKNLATSSGEETEGRIFQAPTFRTYRRFLKGKLITLPNYACKKTRFKIKKYDR